MDEINNPSTEQPVQVESEEAPTQEDIHKKLLDLAKKRFKQGYAAHQNDFEKCAEVQSFIAGDQWPQGIKAARETDDRPCLVLDHLNQYVRHVVNSALMQHKDVRVMAMSGEADDKVSEVLAGMIRQIVQVSTARVAYETGLRHECQYGFGYWRVKVQGIPGTGLSEITIRKIKDPRMVLLDPFCEYPDGRDAHWGFVLTKLTRDEFNSQYSGPDGKSAEGAMSWHDMDTSQTLPWVGEDVVVVAEYYYQDTDDAKTMRWAIMCPDRVLDEGVHHGNVMPIIRAVGEEFEAEGKERKRGLVNDSSMDAQRAYNYASSASIESVALAPLAPFVAEEGQIEQYIAEWKDAHKTPRAVLRYKGTSLGGQLIPPPMRQQPAGVPAGWQGIMGQLIGDIQMIMGLAQPSVTGTGGSPVQSGAGINAQQEPGEINSYHFHEHWHIAIEQTGRVVMAMIPHVYTKPQIVKIIGEDGKPGTAMLNPSQQSAHMEVADAVNKVGSVSYNPNIGRYDAAISTGPSSATKKAEANKMLMTVVNADPTVMQKAGDLVVESFDMAGANTLAKRLKAMLPPGVADDDDGRLAKLQQAMQENEKLKQEVADMEKIIMADQVKSKAKLAEVESKNQADMQQLMQDNQSDMFKERMGNNTALHTAILRSQTDLEINAKDSIVKIIVAKIAAKSKIDVELVKAFTTATEEPTHEGRMSGYLGVLGSLTSGGEEPVGSDSSTVPAASIPA